MGNHKMKHPMAVLGGTRPLAAALALAGATALFGAGSVLAQTTSTVTRSVSYEYDAYGQLKKETVQPEDSALRVSTEYTRAAVGGVDFGLVSAKTVTWLDPVSGTTKSRAVLATGYDAQGRFALTQTNAKSQTVTSVYDAATGAVISVTDPNQLTTSVEVDAWGRKLRESRADDTVTSTMLRTCIDSCGDAVTVMVTQQWGGAGLMKSQTAVPKEDFYDRLGRLVKSRTWGFDGTPVITETAFTAQGYTDSVARPRFQGAAPVWTYYERDDIGRVNKIRSPAPDGSGYADTTYTYDGRVLSMRNAKGQTRVEERNALGKLKAATDALGHTTSYLYDGFGNLARTQDPLGNVISIGYDALGRKTSLSDPDVGQVAYWVDPLGQTWKQRDAKAQETTFEFDELGRMVRRLEPDLDSRWVYDTTAKGVGKLAESFTWVNGAKDVRRVVSYDAVGRPSVTVASLDWDYVTQTSYDGFGRANVQSYTRRTRGATGGGVTTAIVNGFNAMGYVDKTYRRSDGVDTLVWQGLAIDAEGRDTKQRIGVGALVVHGYNPNSGRLESIVSGAASGNTADGTLQNDVYQYDVLGNLALRAQLNGVGTLLQESFEYDELNRLKTSYLGSQTNAFAYDALGNITSKANVGTYSYPTSGYGAVRPHAVTGITGTVAGLTNPGFSYDANGNLVNGLNRAYTWTAADTPLTIDKLSGGQAVQRTEFVYGPEHERVRQVVRTMSGGQPQGTVNTVVYAGAIEKEVDAEKGVTIIRTSLGADGFVEERITGTTVDANTAGTRNARFFLKDHLGSTIGIVDEGGQLLQRMSYDAWGRRRNVDGSDDSWTSLGTIKNDQDNSGYTGHEQMDQLGLVHMNARLYDPITGRHVSADPTVPDPKNQQAFNRFSYVLNNALVYVDPTGLAPVPFESLTNQFSDFQFGTPGAGCVLWRCREDGPEEAKPLPDKSEEVDKGESKKREDQKSEGNWFSHLGERIKNWLIGGMKFKTDAQMDEWGEKLKDAREDGPEGTAEFFRQNDRPGDWIKDGVAIAATGGSSIGRRGVGQSIEEALAAKQVAKGVTNPEIAKGVFPYVGPLTHRGVGKVIGWGNRGAPDTIARMKSLTAKDVAKMQRQGITRDAAKQIRDFYANEAARNANNATAEARVQLMDKIIGMMK